MYWSSQAAYKWEVSQISQETQHRRVDNEGSLDLVFAAFVLYYWDEGVGWSFL